MSYQRDFAHTLNIGLIGAGSHAYRNILPALTYLPVRLRAICDINVVVAQSTALQYAAANCYATAQEMYDAETLDAVLICVGAQRHPELVREAFRAGMHVWLEKPPAVRSSEILDMMEVRGDRIAVVGFKKAFMPSTVKVRELFESEQYLPLTTILAQYPVTIPHNGQQVLEERTFTNWLANGCHPLSLMIAIGGQVAAVTVHRTQWEDGCCVLEFAGGAIGNLHLTRGAGSSQPSERYSFFGNGCTITIDNCSRVTLQRGIAFDYGVTTTYLPPGLESGAIVWEPQNTLSTLENKALFMQGVYGELRYFCDCVLAGNRAEQGSLEFAHHVTQVYEAALLSGGTRIVVENLSTAA